MELKLGENVRIGTVFEGNLQIGTIFEQENVRRQCSNKTMFEQENAGTRQWSRRTKFIDDHARIQEY